MKSRTINNAIEAHGWVGVIVSIALFIVFWAGGITLFFPEVSAWSSVPLRPTELVAGEAPSLSTILEERIRSVERNEKQPVFVRLPSEHSPFVEVNLRLAEKNAAGNRRERHLVDPLSGALLATANPYHYANFLYRLHYSLKLPQGLYIVGLITLFFLVLVFTGIVIQLKKLVDHFFLYRFNKGRQMRAHDLHSVAGVVTLPFAALYSLTGLMFNLKILIYLPVLMFSYGGDRNTFQKDIRPGQPEIEAAGVPAALPDLEALFERVKKKHHAEVTGFSIINYGDENAVLRINANTGEFADQTTLFYEPKSESFPKSLNLREESIFLAGITPLFTLHMGKFGGAGVRLLLLALAFGVCGMIIAGNVLWLIKREKKLVKFRLSHKVVRGLTLGGCTGVVLATCVGFLLERALPADLGGRTALVQWSFAGVLAAVTIVGFAVSKIRPFLSRCAWISALTLSILVGFDLVVYGQQMAKLWAQGDAAVGAVAIGFAVSAACFAWLGRWLDRGQNTPLAEGTTSIDSSRSVAR